VRQGQKPQRQADGVQHRPPQLVFHRFGLQIAQTDSPQQWQQRQHAEGIAQELSLHRMDLEGQDPQRRIGDRK
jgi:hypothetical protein